MMRGGIQKRIRGVLLLLLSSSFLTINAQFYTDGANTNSTTGTAVGTGYVGIGEDEPDRHLLIANRDTDPNNTWFLVRNIKSHPTASGGFNMLKARGLNGSPQAVQLNDRIGFFLAGAYDGSAYRNSVGISFKIDDNPTIGYAPAKIVFETGDPRQDRMTIGSDGGVTIHGLSGNAGSALILDANGKISAGAPPAVADTDWVENAGDVHTLGNVGIGEALPVHPLHISAGSIVLFGSSLSGTGVKMMWLPADAAFRAGEVEGSEWDASNIGYASFASGKNAKASGNYSFAFGRNVSAAGGIAIAMGEDNSANGNRAVSLGRYTEANGYAAVSIGFDTEANGYASVALGGGSIVTGDYSFGVGYQNIVPGYYGMAAGASNTVSGTYGVAMGTGNLASQNAAVALGFENNAIGAYSFAANQYTTSSGNISAAFGQNTKAESYMSFVVGRFNEGGGSANSWEAEDALFEVGMGTHDTLRVNALTIFKNGRIGIGVSAPEYRLDLPNLANAEGRARSNGWLAYSSGRWKENVETLENASDKVKELRGVSFDWKKEHGGRADIGFIAEEIGKVLPEVVDWEEDGKFAAAVNYSAVIPVLVEAFKEQETKLADKEQEIEELKSELEAVNSRMDKIEALLMQNSQRGNKELRPQGATKLGQNQPNPFSESTFIPYQIEAKAKAEIKLFDLNGTLLRSYPLNGTSGRLQLKRNELASGVYIYTMTSNGKLIESRKLVIQ